jgi:signal peptidase I
LKGPSKSTTIIVAVFVAVLLLYAYAQLTYTRRVDGTSMLPTLENGDLVVVVHAPFDQLKLGDIIVYSPPCSQFSELVIHRIVAFSNASGYPVTKGDNNPYSDPVERIAAGPITPSCYVGKVVFVVPYIERIASLPFGTNYILAALILAAVIYLELRGGGKGDQDAAGRESHGEPVARSSTGLWRRARFLRL